MTNSMFNTFRSFFGFPPQSGGEPANEFRNPIWGSGDDDDDDDDELYHRRSGQRRDVNIDVYTDPAGVNSVMSRQMQDVFQMFGSIFGDVRSMFDDEHFDHFGSVMDITPDASPHEPSIRDHYLKPGYNIPKGGVKQDIDLDGKVSSDEIAGLLKRKEPEQQPHAPARPAHSGAFFQTIITKSVTKPDGTVETRRIVKDHLGNVEETLTTTQKDGTNPQESLDIARPFMRDDFFKDFTSFWKIF